MTSKVAVKFLCLQGCDCAANWLILANSDQNFVISEISVNQVRKCFPAWVVGVFTIQEQLCKCHHCRTFLRILANFPLVQSHPWFSKLKINPETPPPSIFSLIFPKSLAQKCLSLVLIFPKLALSTHPSSIFSLLKIANLP